MFRGLPDAIAAAVHRSCGPVPDRVHDRDRDKERDAHQTQHGTIDIRPAGGIFALIKGCVVLRDAQSSGLRGNPCEDTVSPDTLSPRDRSSVWQVRAFRTS